MAIDRQRAQSIEMRDILRRTRASKAFDPTAPGTSRSQSGTAMLTLSALLLENGLHDLPVVLIEPHRNPGEIWRIRFSYETGEPLSMSAVQASTMAAALHKIGEAELAEEIDGALKTAIRYASM
jgi:hypothetical protein